jgi:hypothetical protein
MLALMWTVAMSNSICSSTEYPLLGVELEVGWGVLVGGAVGVGVAAVGSTLGTLDGLAGAEGDALAGAEVGGALEPGEGEVDGVGDDAQPAKSSAIKLARITPIDVGRLPISSIMRVIDSCRDVAPTLSLSK